MTPRWARKLAPLAVAMGLAVTGCSSAGGGEAEDAPEAAASGGANDLSGVCPDPLVIQKDWQPESEHGYLYQLLGEGYTVDTNAKKISGPLVAGGHDTGITLEIRSGGPAVGFQPVPAVMYTDESIHLGFVTTDEAVQFSAEQPTKHVLAQLEISPLAILWDKETYPEFNTIADIGQTDTKVLHSEGLAYMEYLTGSGILRESQLDGSYDGSPAAFVGYGGKAATQGYATSEPYIYEEQVEAWGKPLEFQLINDTNFPYYATTTSIRTGDEEELAPCLERIVPIFQQSQIDFVQNPDRAIQIILEAVKGYNTGWVYTQGLADYSAQKMTELGIVSNGADSTLGNMEEERIQRIIDIMTPILAGQRKPVKENLQPSDLFTNDYVDEGIGLPAS